ncbi:metallophosphoesterase [Flammeovirga sp. OC4]|uniref:metallophosphoesterase family protein n=1 Tax=Flammeovirga sp. OC4 TaxID=1382345 RepID=UPI0005C4B5A3|nr:metallophosphoesterase [Flammeovirga sp. OC4]
MKNLHLLLLLGLFCISCSEKKSVKFAVCTDVHQDIIHDAPQRLQTFVKQAQKEKADFIIQLGDFCYPKEQNQDFLKVWNSFAGQKYHVLGNHDMDVSSKEEVMNYIDMKENFYSFDQGAFHFIVLDPNFFVEYTSYVDYEKGNYFAHKPTRATLPQNQLDWLKEDLAQTNKKVIVFSHQNLDGESGVKNRDEVRCIFEEANQEVKKVIACFSGHDHHDDYHEINGIHYIRINSMSYEWVGKEFQCKERFPDEVNDYRPALKNTVPYKIPVYAIVEVNEQGYIDIMGVEGDFIAPGPKDLGVNFDYEISPSVSDRYLKF